MGGLRCNRQCDHDRQLLQRLAQHLCRRRIRRRTNSQRPDVRGQSRQIKQELAKIVEKQVEGEVRDEYGFVPRLPIKNGQMDWFKRSLLPILHASICLQREAKGDPIHEKASKSFFSIFHHFV